MNMISQDRAFDIIRRELSAVGTETLPLEAALGRVLARDVIARLTHPARAVSAMDGYAVNSRSLDTIPVDLPLVDLAQAGGPLPAPLPLGTACRIFTGAPLPDGADTIVIQENTEQISAQKVRVTQGEKPGRFVRPAGLDFSAGDVGLCAGQRLNERDLALAAAMGQNWLCVFQQPRIGVLATGDEIVLPGDSLGDNQIISSNSVALCAFITRQNATPIFLGLARDDDADLRDKMRHHHLDLIVTTGGASVGDFDLVRRLLSQDTEVDTPQNLDPRRLVRQTAFCDPQIPQYSAVLENNFPASQQRLEVLKGVQIFFNKLAVRPGKPVIFARHGGLPILALPGNPVSAIVGAYTLLDLAMQCLSGVAQPALPFEWARLGCDLPENDTRLEYMRATLSERDSELWITPFGKQDSGMLSTLQKATALLIRPAHADKMHEGSLVQMLRLSR